MIVLGWCGPMKDHLSRIFGLADRGSEIQTEEVRNIPIDEIVPSPYQPRTIFDDDKLDELCQTIRTHGVIQPIVVRVRNQQYEIIAGERRWRAVKKLEWETIPAIVKEFNDGQAASIALIENLQREGLTAIEEAIAYKKLIEIHGLTQENLAQRLGKSQSTIANKIRLLNLSPAIQDALLSRDITERHARALLSLRDPESQGKLLFEILEKDLNVKQTETRIKQILDKLDNQEKPKPKRVAFSRDVRLAMNTIRQSVDMVLKTGLTLETDEKDHEDYYEFVIKIPKNK